MERKAFGKAARALSHIAARARALTAERARSLSAVRAFLPVAAALFCAALLILPQRAAVRPLFEGAAYYQFYAGSASSQAQIFTAEGEDAARVKGGVRALAGEAAFYARGADALAQAEALGGVFLFARRSGACADYYYFSPRLGGGVVLEGKLVNLHVRLGGGGGAVGTPLIFG